MRIKFLAMGARDALFGYGCGSVVGAVTDGKVPSIAIPIAMFFVVTAMYFWFDYAMKRAVEK